jgi:hypothetical protein
MFSRYISYNPLDRWESWTESDGKKMSFRFCRKQRTILLLYESSKRCTDIAPLASANSAGTLEMTLKPVDRVRRAVTDRLAQLSGGFPTSLYEAILIRNGLFCGRKFQWEGYEVVWFLEEDEIKFFGPCGNLLAAESLICFLGAQTEGIQDLHQQSPAAGRTAA